MSKVVAVVIENEVRCRLLRAASEDVATTLVAVASEDPSNWNDMVSCWPRYRTAAASELVDNLAWESVGIDTLRNMLEQGVRADPGSGWLVIDIVNKRVLCGGSFDIGASDQVFTLQDDHSGQEFPLSVHLPPWWELHEQSDVQRLDGQRVRPLNIPRVDREVLYGQPLLQSLSRRMLEFVDSPGWATSGAATKPRELNRFTVQVHRDWLMTPRADLDGRVPRQLLHGAHRWLESLTAAQQRRLLADEEMVALPDNVSDYETAPMGSQEMILYFDLCRELIDRGWQWCIRNATSLTDQQARQQALVSFLEAVERSWLSNPYEDGAPPEMIIEYSRRRVPRVSGAPIVGMSMVEPEQHAGDCNCPICKMLAEGMLGPSIEMLDGYHLELDDEFAFSMYETREEWEAERCVFDDLGDDAESQDGDEALVEADEFDSVWSGATSADPIPGDRQGHLQLAFLLAEIVSHLESTGSCQAEIRQLNQHFTRFRQAAAEALPAAAERLKVKLENLGELFPELVPQLADFQSRIDEHLRCPIGNDDLAL